MNLRFILAATAVAWTFSGSVRAAEPPPPYAGVMGEFYFADPRLHLDNGYGGRGYVGFPILEGVAIELSAVGYDANPNHAEYVHMGQIAGGIDLIAAPFNLDDSITPILILGGAYGGSNGGGYGKSDNAYIDAGLGFVFKLGREWSVRTEARYVGFFADKNNKGVEDFPHRPYNDVLAGIGLQYAFVGPLAPPPPPPPEVRVVQVPVAPPPPADSDGDGVLDPADQCPGTPHGVTVDARGCPLDSDGDGVPDYLDKCPNTPRGLRVDATGCVHEAQTIVLQDVNFEFNKDTLTPTSQDVLREVAKGLTSQTDLRVEIGGHTDSKGSDAYNLKLSDRRAASVRRFLVSQGVASQQLLAKGYGETQPIASNDTDEGRARNRRVEFRVLKR